jgi:hypothetical protein
VGTLWTAAVAGVVGYFIGFYHDQPSGSIERVLLQLRSVRLACTQPKPSLQQQ